MTVPILKFLYNSILNRQRLDQDMVGMKAKIISHLAAGCEQDNLMKLPLWDVPFLVIDTETTGLHPMAGDEIIWFAAVPMSGLTIEENKMYDNLVNPQVELPLEIQELTGVRPEQLAGAPTIYTVLEQFLTLAFNRVLVGYRLDFDFRFINLKLRRCCKTKLNHHVLDVAVLYRALHPEASDFTLDQLVRKYDIDAAGRHTAPGDALVTAKLLVILLREAAQSRNLNTLAQLYYFLHWRAMF
ncbi:hypothetical protein MFMK1_003422 [Metallumcola ferriviriculae]|uniref:Exonuclease domain-containing protein n=1 Tax=Metallumcola ferriviriculae TaxID=3039180 RepID=A0AAU0UQH0_9FIRM|nr:hypothetical protein MFMK1_003422 [Desulfitibacteraceae bacterium MK1]